MLTGTDVLLLHTGHSNILHVFIAGRLCFDQAMLIKRCSLNTIRILESHKQSGEHKKKGHFHFFLQENWICRRKSMGESCYRPLFLNIAVSPACTTQWVYTVQSNWNLFLRNRIIFFSLMVCASHIELYKNPGKTDVGTWKLEKQPDPQLQGAAYFLVQVLQSRKKHCCAQKKQIILPDSGATQHSYFCIH